MATLTIRDLDDAVKAQLADDVLTTAITEAELRMGLAILPQGQRRRSLAERLDAALMTISVEERFRSTVTQQPSLRTWLQPVGAAADPSGGPMRRLPQL